MAQEVNAERLIQLDEELMHEGVEPHDRSYKIASKLMAEAGFLSYSFEHPYFKALIEAYGRLFPNANKTQNWIGYGIVASLDDVRKVTVPYIMGSTMIHVHELCGFETHDDYSVWVRGRTDIACQTALASFDALDFAYGTMDYTKQGEDFDGSAHLYTAKANIEEVARNLPESGNYQTLAQCIHLTAETSMKAVLKHYGVSDREIRSRALGHDLRGLASRVAIVSPRVEDDIILKDLVSDFPDFVAERYTVTHRPRLAVVRNALAAQFIAGSCARRLVPNRDSTGFVERDGVKRDISWYRD